MNTPFTIICWAFYVYGATLLLTNAHIFGFWRSLLRTIRRLFGGDYEVERCRMCQGMWVCLLLLCLGALDPIETGVVYGMSYFLATQER